MRSAIADLLTGLAALFLFLLVGIGIGWAMFPFSR